MSQKSREAQANAFKEKVDLDLVRHTLSKCKYCFNINPYHHAKQCEDCILLSAGIIDEIPKPDITLFRSDLDETEREKAKKEIEQKNVEKELMIEKNMRVAELLNQCSDMLNALYYIAGQKHIDNEFIQCQNIALEDKCNRFGRPSKLSSRTFLYITHWKNADPKPSYNALSKIVKVSTTQVIRDLKELGWIAADKYIDEYVEE